MHPRLPAYLRAAFNFRPFGMFVAPNWVMLALAALLGLVNPGFLLLGLAAEGIYLMALTQSARFRALVDAHLTARRDAPALARTDAVLATLSPADNARYARQRAACEAILAEPRPDEPVEATADRARVLERMLGVFLELLAARQVLVRATAARDATVPARLTALRRRLAGTPPGELYDSLADQAGVLVRRADALLAADARAAWLDAELGRIEEHVGLLRDQALLPGDTGLADDVDRLTERLAAADRWLSEQQALEALSTLDEPPRLRPVERQSR
jgi:hypothetical protein